MVVIGLIAVLVGTGACGNGDDDLPAPPATPAATPSTSPPTATLDARDAEAWQEIQTKFDAFMEAWIKWSAEGAPGGFNDPAIAELHEYADEMLWGEVSAELTSALRNDHRRVGRPEWRDARLMELDWEREVQGRVIPEAVFEVCVDERDWIVVAAGSGEPIATEQAEPRVWTITAWWAEEREFGPDGWALAQREVGGGPC